MFAENPPADRSIGFKPWDETRLRWWSGRQWTDTYQSRSAAESPIEKAVRLRLVYDDTVKHRADLGPTVIDIVGKAASAWLDAENALTTAEYNEYQIIYNTRKASS